MPEKSFNLTPAKQALLEALLKEKGLSLPKWRLISRSKTGEPAPLSFAQQRLWFLALMERDGYVYNVPSVYHIHGLLDIQALEDSLNEIVRRHAILRTTFIEIDQQARQIVAPELKIRINQVDWRSVPEAGAKPLPGVSWWNGRTSLLIWLAARCCASTCYSLPTTNFYC